MKKTVKLLLSISLISLILFSCEKGCICTNLDNGAAEELYGVYSKKDCEAYTDYYKTISDKNNVDCTMQWK